MKHLEGWSCLWLVAGLDIGLEEHLGAYALSLLQHVAWHDHYSAIWQYVPKQSAPMLLEHGLELELEPFSPLPRR